MSRLYGALLSVLLASSPAWAAPPFPDAKQPPVPVPAPPPQPGGAIDLKAGEVYVIDAKTDGVLLVEPAGLVRVAKRKGPLTVNAAFADSGTGEEETRDFAGPVLWIVHAAKGKSGKLNMAYIPFGFADAKQVVTEVINVNGGQAPQPPPTPAPAPSNGTGEWVIVIANESMPNDPAQGKLIDGPTLGKYKAAGKCRVYGDVNEADKIAKQNYDKAMKNAGVTSPALIVLDGKGVPVLVSALPLEESKLADALKGAMKP